MEKNRVKSQLMFVNNYQTFKSNINLVKVFTSSTKVFYLLMFQEKRNTFPAPNFGRSKKNIAAYNALSYLSIYLHKVLFAFWHCLT